jgi:hypothetical protein
VRGKKNGAELEMEEERGRRERSQAETNAAGLEGRARCRGWRARVRCLEVAGRVSSDVEDSRGELLRLELRHGHETRFRPTGDGVS